MKFRLVLYGSYDFVDMVKWSSFAYDYVIPLRIRSWIMWTLTSPTWFVSTLMSPDGNGVYINLFCILRPSSHFTDYWLIFFFFSSFFLFQWSLFDHDTLRQRRGRFFCTRLAGCMVSTHTVICTWWNCYVDCFTQTCCIVCCKIPVFIGSVASIDLPFQINWQIHFATFSMALC